MPQVEDPSKGKSKEELLEEEATKHRDIRVALRELYDAALAGEDGRHYLRVKEIRALSSS